MQKGIIQKTVIKNLQKALTYLLALIINIDVGIEAPKNNEIDKIIQGIYLGIFFEK